jgi:hypothetical protein
MSSSRVLDKVVAPTFGSAGAGLKPGATTALILTATIMFAAASLFGAASKPTVKSIGQGLICQCGCAQTVYGCNHFECPSRSEMNALTEKEIVANKD